MFYFSAKTGGIYDMSFHDYELPADAVEITAEERAALFAAQQSGKIIQADADGKPVAVDRPAETLAAMKARLSAAIDSLVEGIYEKYTKFQVAYTPREAAARAFKAAGYVGDPGLWVTGFAGPAGLTNQQAADKIIAQADAAYAALPLIDAQRMRKYSLAAADGMANAQALYDDIVAQIATAAASLQ
jgi:hypothetical protein